MNGLGGLAAQDLVELAPALRRAVTLDPRALTRVRASAHEVSALVRLPFGVLTARTVSIERDGPGCDATVRATELLAWLDGEEPARPQSRDSQWRGSLPPAAGWQRIDSVPDDVVRRLVRAGAQALTDAAVREGVPGAQPRAGVADALLDSVVLTVSAADAPSAPITLRVLSALTRMGFLPRGSTVAVDVAGRWTRIAAEFGSVYDEGPLLAIR